MAYHQRRNVILHEALQRVKALLMRQRIQIRALHAAYYLQPVRVKVIVKPGELHGRTVDVRRGQRRLFIVRRGVQRVELMLLNYRLQLDCVFRAHGAILLHINIYTTYIKHFCRVWQQLFSSSTRIRA